MAAPVTTEDRPHLVGWTGWENWEEASSENVDGWQTSSKASSDRSNVASWSAGSWSSEHRDWRGWGSTNGERHWDGDNWEDDGSWSAWSWNAGRRANWSMQSSESVEHGGGAPGHAFSNTSSTLLLRLDFIKHLRENIMGMILKKGMEKTQECMEVAGSGMKPEGKACRHCQRHQLFWFRADIRPWQADLVWDPDRLEELVEVEDILSSSYPPIFYARPGESWQEYWRTVEFWLASEGKSLPPEVRLMQQLRERAGKIVWRLTVQEVAAEGGIEIIRQTMEKSPIIKILDTKKVDKRRRVH